MSFEDNEEHIINNILSCLNEKTEVLRQQIVNKRKLVFDGLRIDEHKRIVVREDDPSKPMYIQTVWGVGYRFNKNLSSGL